MTLFARRPQPARRPTPGALPAAGRRGVGVAILVAAGAFVVNLVTARAAAGPRVLAVVAAHAIPSGVRLGPQDVTTHPLQGVAHVYTHLNAVVGQVTTEAIPAGAPILPGMIGRTAERNGIAYGEVGIWIPVNLATSALAQPGERVDVLFASTQLAPSGSQRITVSIPPGLPLVSGARVIGVVNSNGAQLSQNGQPGANASGAPAAVEIAVPASAAGQLVEAETLGTLTLVQDPWATRVRTVEIQPSASPASASPTSGTPSGSAPAAGSARSAATPTATAPAVSPAPASSTPSGG